jgi:hypothetical protein
LANYDLGPGEVETATRSVPRNVELAANDEERSLTGGKSASVLPKIGRLPRIVTEAAAIKPKLAACAHQEADHLSR